VEDDIQGIAKSVTDNYDDEEIRRDFVNISLDLYVPARAS
jgi:nuclear cap-binding protein subunit 1